jgi:hypothetical protein
LLLKWETHWSMAAGLHFAPWAPRAFAVYFNGIFHGTAHIGESDDLLLFRDANGCWSELAVEAPAGDL